MKLLADECCDTVPPSPDRPLLTRIFLSPDERRLRAGWRLLVYFILLMVSSVVFGAALGSMFLVFPALQGDWMWAYGGIVSLLAITVSVYLARRLLDRRPFTSLGLVWNRQAVRDLLFGIALPVLMMGLVYFVELTAGWLRFEGFAWEFTSAPQAAAEIAIMGFFFVLVGWQEELLFRGYWLQNITDGLNIHWGVLISSVIFALAHLANPNTSVLAILGLVLAGFFLAYAYLRTRQLWLSIGLHIGWNFFEGTVFGFQVSGMEGLPRLIHQSVQGPEVITGGAFGPEAGLVILPSLALGVLLIWWYTRKPGRV